jgi:signal transduction histidine kinase
MSQTHLENALHTLEGLYTVAPQALHPQLDALRADLHQAYQAGEGQAAETLRETLQEREVKTSEFISVMVHEIRKPMTSIRGYADMLHKKLMGELNDMQSQFVGTIRNNVISMEQLVTDISDMSKLRAGRIKPTAKMDTFKNIVMQLEKDFTEVAAARQQSLSFDLPQGLPLLNLDSGLFEKSLRKILDNALKYSPEGTGEIRLAASGEAARLRVTISDNGVGMSAAELERLGELFFRGDNEVVAQTKGYGMGVPIAKACLELLGGHITWTSTKSGGTVCTIHVPALS